MHRAALEVIGEPVLSGVPGFVPRPFSPQNPVSSGMHRFERRKPSGKKKVTKSHKRPACGVSIWGLAGTGEVSERDGGTAAQNPWLSVTGCWPAGASQIKPNRSHEEPW